MSMVVHISTVANVDGSPYSVANVFYSKMSMVVHISTVANVFYSKVSMVVHISTVANVFYSKIFYSKSVDGSPYLYCCKCILF